MLEKSKDLSVEEVQEMKGLLETVKKAMVGPQASSFQQVQPGQSSGGAPKKQEQSQIQDSFSKQNISKPGAAPGEEGKQQEQEQGLVKKPEESKESEEKQTEEQVSDL